MAKTIQDALYISASPANAIHTAAGILRGFLICVNTTSAATVTFYDNTTATGTVLMLINLPASGAPFYVQFPRDYAPRFAIGLSITFTNADVHIWSVDFG